MMDQPMYTPCAEWAEKLAATHPDDLSPSDRVALDMHVASCPACATVRAEYQAIDALILDLRGVEPLPDLPIRLQQPRQKLTRLGGSYALVPISSLAALTVGETASGEVDREVSLPAIPEQDSLLSFFADEGDIELPSPIPPERSFSQTQSPVEPAPSGLPGMMSLSELADHCMSEINNYRRGEASSDQYCLELFRRAMPERDDAAWALLVERFHEYMLGLFRRHVRQEAAARLDSPENYVARAFERFWLAAVHNQQLEFTTLAAALSYLRNCLNGAILDTLRAHSRSKGVALPEPGFAAYFRQVSFFADLPDEDIRALMAVARKRTFRAGEIIFHRDDVGQVLYVIKEGKVNICRISPEGQEISLVVLGKGDCFGELAILDGLPRSADAIALERVECYTLQRSDFYNAIMKNPKIATQVLEVLSSRLRKTDDLVEDLVVLDVYGRVAKKLLDLAHEHGVEVENGIRIDIRLTQQDLASMVGASRESVNKVLVYFTDKGYISSDKHKIALHRIEELQRRIY